MWDVKCVDCGFESKKDVEQVLVVCKKCAKNYDLARLWKLHNKGELDALDFNESSQMRERFRR